MRSEKYSTNTIALMAGCEVDNNAQMKLEISNMQTFPSGDTPTTRSPYPKARLIEQENDPTQLRSPSPGKLVRFLVDSGDHVSAGEQYAEIEVSVLIIRATPVHEFNEFIP